MTKEDLVDHLSALHLDSIEAAQLLGVSPRTLRRWLEGEPIPGPAEAALHAWRTLAERHLPWKPDSLSILEDDQDQIQRHNRHTQEIAKLIEHVEKRGGEKNPWTVDIGRGTATFGPFEVGFYKLQSEGFSLSNYRRKDQAPDMETDREFIEDATYCISKAFAKAKMSNEALRAVAEYTRKNSWAFAQKGPKLLDQAEKKQRERLIESLADKINELAIAALDGVATYGQFESILRELHGAGFFPELELVSKVARSMV
jgi:hypothetical protein